MPNRVVHKNGFVEYQSTPEEITLKSIEERLTIIEYKLDRTLQLSESLDNKLSELLACERRRNIDG